MQAASSMSRRLQGDLMEHSARVQFHFSLVVLIQLKEFPQLANPFLAAGCQRYQAH
jgi:hypothetical protein